MSGSPHERPTTAIFIEGEVSPEKRLTIERLLTEKGLEFCFSTFEPSQSAGINRDAANLISEEIAEAMAPEDQIQQIHEHGFRFQDLTSGTHVMVYEHFLDFARTNHQPSNAYTVAWQKLAAGGVPSRRLALIRRDRNGRPSKNWIQVNDPMPLTGGRLIPRYLTGLPDYIPPDAPPPSPDAQILLGGYCLEAGSVLRALSLFRLKDKGELKSKADLALRQIALQLTSQLELESRTE
jgi:hypothetical protein